MAMRPLSHAVPSPRGTMHRASGGRSHSSPSREQARSRSMDQSSKAWRICAKPRYMSSYTKPLFM